MLAKNELFRARLKLDIRSFVKRSSTTYLHTQRQLEFVYETRSPSIAIERYQIDTFGLNVSRILCLKAYSINAIETKNTH